MRNREKLCGLFFWWQESKKLSLGTGSKHAWRQGTIKIQKLLPPRANQPISKLSDSRRLCCAAAHLASSPGEPLPWQVKNPATNYSDMEHQKCPILQTFIQNHLLRCTLSKRVGPRRCARRPSGRGLRCIYPRRQTSGSHCGLVCLVLC